MLRPGRASRIVFNGLPALRYATRQLLIEDRTKNLRNLEEDYPSPWHSKKTPLLPRSATNFVQHVLLLHSLAYIFL